MNNLLKQVLLGLRKLTLCVESRFDREFLAPDVPLSKTVGHGQWKRFLYAAGNKPGMRILEIGSREVTGASNDRNAFARAAYTGFDYYPEERRCRRRRPQTLLLFRKGAAIRYHLLKRLL